MPDPVEPNLLARTQAGYNRSTRDHWDHFAAHRWRVTELLAPSDFALRHGPPGDAAPAGRLCVLGAGNCNDLDLPHLLETFGRVTLVDVDRAAVEAAVARQGVAGHPRVDVRGGVDLTGVADAMAGWANRPPTDREVDACVDALDAGRRPDVGGPFDVILSPCVLSQICLSATDALGRRHPRKRDVRDAIRRRHVRQMVEWLAPGGTGLLVIDLATTERVGSLVHTHKDRLAEVAARTVGNARHFPGLDPDTLRSALTDDPRVSGMVAGVQSVAPWLWTLGPHKSFLVYAIRFRRTGTPVLDTRS